MDDWLITKTKSLTFLRCHIFCQTDNVSFAKTNFRWVIHVERHVKQPLQSVIILSELL